MRTVILGGSGFIGSALAAHLASRGESVVIPSRSERPQTPHIKYVQWDGRNPAQLAEILADATAVVNLLGENIAAGRWTEERKARLVSSRVRAGEALQAACKAMATPPQTIIQGSAVGYYGAWPDAATAPLCHENSPAGENFLAGVVTRWEAAGAEVADMPGLPHIRRCVIRTSPVLGPGGGMLTPLLPLFRRGLGGRVGSGRQPFPWIHLHDEVAAIDFLLRRHDLSGVFNLAAPCLNTMADFVGGLAQAVRRPAVLPVPGFVLRLALGEMADELLLNGQNVRPERLFHAGFVFRFTNIEAALVDCVQPGPSPSPL